MPRCLNCGNTAHFSSSKVPAAFAWHGNSGLVASFDPQGNIINWENSGVDHEGLQKLLEKPNFHMDSCVNCGSHNVIWP
jgi:hypothetical protein